MSAIDGSELTCRVPSVVPPQSAVARVFAIPELFTSILDYLPELALIATQRVSKQFRIAITQQRFQKKLFFLSEVCDRSQMPRNHIEDLGTRRVAWNPFLHMAKGMVNATEMHFYCRNFAEIFMKRVDDSSKQVFYDRRGCWENMHITQPSSNGIILQRDDTRQGGVVIALNLAIPQGVRLGHISELVRGVFAPYWDQSPPYESDSDDTTVREHHPPFRHIILSYGAVEDFEAC